MAQTQSEKRGRLPKNLIMLALVAAAAVFVYFQYQKRQLIQRENEGIGLQNAGRYQEAIHDYDALLPLLKGDKARKRVDSRIAHCYAAMAENPALSYKEALALYKQAYQLDPATVTNPAFKKALEASK